MAPLTDPERQKLLLQQEIAQLSGAISRHATVSHHPPSYHPYSRRRPSTRGQSNARGHGRERGGKTYGLDLRAANKASSAAASNSPIIDSIPLPPTAVEEKEAGEVLPPPLVTPDEVVQPSGKGKEVEKDWVKKTSKGGNMSLMTVEKSNLLQSRPPPPRRPRRPKVPANVQVLNSMTTSDPGGGEGKRVVIDGVIFQFEQGGKKLARIGELSPTVRITGIGSSAAVGTPTRKSLEYGGQKFRRTNRGNLISSLSRSELAKKPCRYYTKTGRCNRALTCPYAHVPDRLAICSRFLRSTCPNDASSCPLSHSPSAHNTPSCVHFQASSSCRNGPTCPYPHVRVSDDAVVCEAFAREGWCEKEEGTCPELHIWECEEWRAKGTCSRGPRCGLKHVIRAEKGKESIKEVEAEGIRQEQGMQGRSVALEGNFEDGAEFIEFGPEPPGASSFKEAEDEEAEDEEAEDEEAEDEEGESENSEEEGGRENDESADDKAESAQGKQDMSSTTLPQQYGNHGHDSTMDIDEADEDEVLSVVF